MGPPTWRHVVLGDFLRTRREALSPETVGLTRTPRRRTPGLRREDVAAAAFVSPTWYTRLEQGRAVRPSVEVLDSLADALRLDATGRSYLQALAAPEHTTPTLVPPPETRTDIEATVLAVGDPGCPVYAADGHGDLLSWNAAASDWYGDFDGCDPPNITRWMFCSPAARRILPDWPDEARDLAARTRFHFASSGADRVSHDLIAELRATSEEFDGWWSRHEISAQAATHRRLARDDGTVVTFRFLVLRVATCPAVSVVVHLPDAPGHGDGDSRIVGTEPDLRDL